MKIYDLPVSDVLDSPLVDLALEAGYASLVAMLNDRRLWGAEVADIESGLRAEIAAINARLAK